MKKSIALVFAFIALAAGLSFAAVTPYPTTDLLKSDPDISADDRAALERGELIYRRNSKDMPGGIAMAYVKAPPQKVYEAATTYSKYLEFMPGALKVEVEETSGNASLVYAEYSSEWPYEKIFIESVNMHETSDPKRLVMTWKATRSSFKTAYGYWIVKPFQDGSLVIYEMGFDLNWVPRALAKSSGKKRVLSVVRAVMLRAQKSS